MAGLKMPEINSVVISGNLTRDPIYRHISNGSSVVNFSIASNKKYRDGQSHWQEEVCFIGVVAWNKLADSCSSRLKKGSAVLIDGELQSHHYKNDDGVNRNIIEIRARRIQFLNKQQVSNELRAAAVNSTNHDEEQLTVEDDSFDKFLTSEESQLLKEQSTSQPQG